MVIMGIDPGIAIAGYSVIDYHVGRFKVLEYGVIRTAAHTPAPQRLKDVYDAVDHIIKRYSPESVAIEELFWNTNAKTGIMIAQARGVLILSAVNNGVDVYEYTPLQVKQAVTGYGRADKTQIQQMVKVLLGLSELPKPDDAADALAIAICHAHSMQTLPANIEN